jgi:hypothetical protein
MQVTGLGHLTEHNTKCDIEIGQVPSCAKCCILRKRAEKSALGYSSLQRIYFYNRSCDLAVYVLLSRRH